LSRLKFYVKRIALDVKNQETRLQNVAYKQGYKGVGNRKINKQGGAYLAP